MLSRRTASRLLREASLHRTTGVRLTSMQGHNSLRMFSSSKFRDSVAGDDLVVGFIGLGNMGLPMASNLAKKERILAFDTNQECMSKLKEQGAMMADSVETVARESSVIVTMLPGCDAVNAVMPALLEASSEDGHGRLFLDCSTPCRIYHSKH